MEHITDHKAQARARLLSQYRDKVTIGQVVDLMTSGVQALEDVAFQLWSETVDGASAIQLDVLGSIVGQTRGGMADPEYRLWILTRTKVNRSNGTPEEIIAIFRALLGPSIRIELQETFPAGFTLTTGTNALLDAVAAGKILQLAKPAGVGAVLISSTSDDSTAFAFAPNGAGFGKATDATVGGMLGSAH